MRSLDEFFTQEGKVVFIKTKKALSLKGSVKMHCLAGGILFWKNIFVANKTWRLLLLNFATWFNLTSFVSSLKK